MYNDTLREKEKGEDTDSEDSHVQTEAETSDASQGMPETTGSRKR